MDLTKLLDWPQDALLVFFLLFCRFSAMLVVAPLFSNQQTPVRLRIGLSVLVAFILLPLALHLPHAHPRDTGGLVVAIASEITVGLLLGFVAMLVFHAVGFAGYMVGLQMGFGMDQIFDPLTGSQNTALATFLTAIATMIFLLLNGHHWLLLALDRSLQVVPPGTFTFKASTMGALLHATDGMFDIVLTLLLPILGILLMAELALAIMSRVMPQMNVFVAGFPIKIALGFASIMIGLPLLVAYFDDLFAQMARQILTFFG